MRQPVRAGSAEEVVNNELQYMVVGMVANHWHRLVKSSAIVLSDRKRVSAVTIRLLSNAQQFDVLPVRSQWPDG